MKTIYLFCWLPFVMVAGACGDSAPSAVDRDASGDAVSDTSVGEDAVAQDVAPAGDSAVDVPVADLADGAMVEDTNPADTEEPAPLPGEHGPWNVGYRTETISYDPADGSPARSLRVVYWYPTTATTGEDVMYFGLLPGEGVLGEAPLAVSDAGAPVVVFSHGNSGFAEQSYFFTNFLASHGFVVVAPDHTGNTFADRDTTPDIFQWRPWDVSAVVDHLDSLSAPHFLAGALSSARAVAGHSFGGYTALAASGALWDVDAMLTICADEGLPLGACDGLTTHETLFRAGFYDARFLASIPMSPGAAIVFGANGVAEVEAPTLLFTGTLDRTTPNASDGDPIWVGLAQDPRNIRVNLQHGAHFTFSNACDLPFNIAENDGCGPAFVDPAEAHRVINALSLAFLKRHFFADDSGASLLSGAEVVSEDAEFSFGQVE